MALGTLAENPDCGLKIVPCGMNYFHAHKFRSRAVIEFGTPLEVPRELVQMYKNGDRRGAVGPLLDIIYQGLVSVTVTSPDYETLMVSLVPLIIVETRANQAFRSSKLHVVCTTSKARNCPFQWLLN